MTLALLLALAAADRPNLVVILADDLGYGDLSCQWDDPADAPVRTPHCDRLAARGLRLLDAHTASAVCSPTRYSVLTGCYAWRSYLQNWVLAETMPLMIEAGRPTLPGQLDEAGYRTAAFGKWHLGWGRDNGAFQSGDLSTGPQACGFGESFVVPFSHNSSESMQVFVRDGAIVGRRPRSLPQTATELSSAAVDWIAGAASQEQPFSLYYATTNVHFPITPADRFLTAAERAAVAAIDPDSSPTPQRAREQRDRLLYPAFVREFDWAVGQVVDALEHAGVLDRTNVVVTSDNGGAVRYGSRNDPWSGTKGELTEGGHRVPWLVCGPGIAAGATSDQLTCTIDLLPTLLTAAGIAGGRPVDGIDLWPHWTGEAAVVERPVVHHSVAGMFAIRRGRWKLVDGLGTGRARFTRSLRENPPVDVDPETDYVAAFAFPHEPFPIAADGGPPGQLIDLVADPSETLNRWAEQPRIAADLLAELGRIRSSGRTGPPERIPPR